MKNNKKMPQKSIKYEVAFFYSEPKHWSVM